MQTRGPSKKVVISLNSFKQFAFGYSKQNRSENIHNLVAKNFITLGGPGNLPPRRPWGVTNYYYYFIIIFEITSIVKDQLLPINISRILGAFANDHLGSLG